MLPAEAACLPPSECQTALHVTWKQDKLLGLLNEIMNQQKCHTQKHVITIKMLMKNQNAAENSMSSRYCIFWSFTVSLFALKHTEFWRCLPQTFDFAKAEWHVFYCTGSIDEHNDSLIATILKVASESMLYREAPEDLVIVPCRRKDCDKAAREGKRNFGNFVKKPSSGQSCWIQIQHKCRTCARNTAKNAQRKCWRTFGGHKVQKTPVRQMWPGIDNV